MKTYTRKQIRGLLGGISKQTLWNWGNNGRFVLPKPVGLRRWPLQYSADEVDKLIDKLVNDN